MLMLVYDICVIVVMSLYKTSILRDVSYGLAYLHSVPIIIIS